jgi:hypothetical protein
MGTWHQDKLVDWLSVVMWLEFGDTKLRLTEKGWGDVVL